MQSVLNFLTGSSDNLKEETEKTDSQKQKLRPLRLLVLEADSSEEHNWTKILKGRRLANGQRIDVEQCAWDEIMVACYTHSTTPIVVHIRPRAQRKTVTETTVLTPRRTTFQPDFLLVRNVARGITHSMDHRKTLFGFMYAGIPSMNSLTSIYHFLERPIAHGALQEINKRLGDDKFPLIPQNYFASHQEMMYGLGFPAVVKVGHGEAGYGKMRIPHHHDFDDFRGVIALTDHYVTAEPFMKGLYDLRIQKLGDHIRVFKRTSISGAWKTNTGSAHLEELELTDRYRLWAEEAGKMFGGLDICTVDVIVTEEKDGTLKEYILEVNDTSSGLAPGYIKEDNAIIADLLLKRLNEEFVEKPAAEKRRKEEEAQAALEAAAAVAAAAPASSASAETPAVPSASTGASPLPGSSKTGHKKP